MLQFWRLLARTFGKRSGLVVIPFVAVGLTVGFTGSAAARYAAMVLDADTGMVLHEENADTRNFPASLTKMMTLYMLFEAIDRGDLSFNSNLTVSRRAAGQAPSKLGLRAGTTITARNAADALIVRSANDVATVVAEALGNGSEVTFAQMMTKRARELGMSRTTFRNASGLPNRGQLSTARDMAVLARALQRDFPHHYGLFSQSKFRWGGRTYRNHNKLLRSYEGTDGIKTGYTRASGYNLVASARRDGRRLIGVVFGGKSASSRNRHMARLLDRAFERAAKLDPLVATSRPRPKPNRNEQATVKVFRPATNDPAAKPVVGGDGAWGIQVGAFVKFAQAKNAADNAAERIPRLAAAAAIDVQTVDAKGRTLYRARLIGMSLDIARRSCGKLQELGLDCALVTPTGGIRMAALADT